MIIGPVEIRWKGILRKKCMDVVRSDGRISAIRVYRKHKDCSLKVAKEKIDEWMVKEGMDPIDSMTWR